MRPSWRVLLLIVCISTILSGCGLWMDGEYVSVTPNHSLDNNHTGDVIVVSSYQNICDMLTELIQNGTEKIVMRVTQMTEMQMQHNIDTAIDYVLRTNPIGAYAVDRITYDIGTSAGVSAIGVEIHYRRSRAEIMQIKHVDNMDAALLQIRVALDICGTGTVLKIKNYKAIDLAQYVENYVEQNPQKCMELPQVSVALYPQYGPERVMEVSFTYQTNRETMRMMQQAVSDVFKSAELYVNIDGEAMVQYSQLYSFLMERYEYTIDTSITPSYSLLRYGVGDSKAFAMVYAAMCRQIGLDCQAISGTKAGSAHHWNVLQVGDSRLHLDLLACNEAGAFAVHTDEEMKGYVWDYSAS